MLAAYIAKRSFSGVYYHFAEASPVEVRTAFVGAKLKMRCTVFARDALSNLISVFAFQLFVFSQGRWVDIYFPADTAAVTAFVGYTRKLFIIFGGEKLHFSSVPPRTRDCEDNIKRGYERLSFAALYYGL